MDKPRASLWLVEMDGVQEFPGSNEPAYDGQRHTGAEGYTLRKGIAYVESIM